MIRALILALQLLTRLPVPASETPPQPKDFGMSVLFFPLIGLLIGGLLASLHTVLWLIDPGVLAAVLLTIWVLLTGGLHLDGLADTADAWIGGQGNRERTFIIMKDPRSGPIAVLAITLLLLVKFTALQALLVSDARFILLLTPVLGRTMVVLLLATTPYVRSEGLGMPYAHYLTQWHCILLVLIVVAATIVILGVWPGGILIAVLGISFIRIRHSLMARLNGTTGDTLGATCELTEAIVLLVPTLIMPTILDAY